MLGFLLIDKRPGITSHDVIYQVRRALQVKRAGHAGTLDPFATGLLVIGVGKATRLLPYLQLEPKVYEGVIRFGVSTNTQDLTGEIVSEKTTEHLNRAIIQNAAKTFLGEIEQIPPMFSAVKVDGERLYKSARKGVEVIRAPRKIKIHKFEIIDYKNDLAKFKLECSGGTYVRTVAHDLGQSLQSCAHLSELRRTNIGQFSIEQASDAESPLLISPEIAMRPMRFFVLSEGEAEMIRTGRPIELDNNAPFVGVTTEQGMLAVCEKRDDKYHPVCVVG